MPESTQREQITAVILAGGQGRRMDYTDKGLLPLAGKPLVQHVIEHIAPQVNALLINCNQHQEEYGRFGYPLYADAFEGYQGPLAGLHSVLAYSDSALFLFVPCDTPLLPDDLLVRMLERLNEEKSELCTVSDGKRLHPVVLLARRRPLENIDEYIRSGRYKVMDWLSAQRLSIADFSDKPQAFTNVNTPDELIKLEQGAPEV